MNLALVQPYPVAVGSTTVASGGGGMCGGGGGTRTTVEGSNRSMWLAVRFGVERLDLVQSTMEWMDGSRFRARWP